MKTVIVKVGGSLLTLPDLAMRLHKMFATLDSGRIFLIAGGGEATDVVRTWDLTHELDEKVAHWLAIDSMSLTGSLLAKLLPDAALVVDHRSAENKAPKGGVAILVARSILDELHDGMREPLPIGWDCTSDSIAGWIATQWKVDSIVLAKSVDVPNECAIQSGPESAAVDAHFDSVINGQIPVYWCNVRTAPESVVLWKPASRNTTEDC
jgi:5-(aminomethyl)-3-furanmethanol phosphate kinase